MGVDWLTCNSCGDTFPDCGRFVSCECEMVWCSDSCADGDGFQRNTCKLGYDIDDNECEKDCYDCDNYLERSCSYCREEDFEDSVLLEFALNNMGLTRNELIEVFKKNKTK